MRTITDSYIVVQNPDGSRTITEQSTEYPMTTQQKITTAVVVTLVAAAPMFPLFAEVAIDKYREKRDARKKVSKK